MCAAKKMKFDSADVMYPVLPDEITEDTPLIQVYVGVIKDSAQTSRIIVELNTKLSVIELNHLKRVRGKEVLLCPATYATDDAILKFIENKGFDVSLLESSVKIVDVAKIKPKTKKQHEVVQKLWPCNFHCDKYLEKICNNALFSDNEIADHIKYMELCVDVAEYDCGKVGCVVVDPKINSVVAVGFGNKKENPNKHAVMIAVDNVAKTQNGGAWKDENISEEIYKDLRLKHENINFGATKYKSKDEISSASDGPYLCTNYYVYITREPCIMCAMALIHSRAKRVFYGAKNPQGGLGSLCKIHTVKDLNHHYEVFGGLLENMCSSLYQ